MAKSDGFTKCANGKIHAFFSWGGYTSFDERAKQVARYDDRQGCGPHTVEQWMGSGYEPYEMAAYEAKRTQHLFMTDVVRHAHDMRTDDLCVWCEQRRDDPRHVTYEAKRIENGQ